ncbi:Tetratricopeptide repeat (TPR)-like superfamily protein isoform 1 [Hibiscus syriacus]|uniref:Tetratricopeptide repeat (TPR)-like superfamily protein isoform 1 n=1 Tax=Hibiscus syriacus TaxID=106335 RepID=A0A6A3BIV8_HIBSY|nr:LEAF RUST 10 DISEASE-RESISTANCE LOCUS RECEPTOR-LIKE PROTEIN KINASE-like 1.5 [Hibiscus syriacus]KAE8716503.1 Tetratricopeptide repeat (TPR)-like superfamily protein isoform 1 [Hibiscus syriacus]
MSPPPSSLLTTVFLFSFQWLLLTEAIITHHSCSSSPEILSISPCPPFSSTPPFPFSSSSGCGHPSFQIKCSSPYSTISVNNHSFSLRTFDPNSSSLTVSPLPPSTSLSTTSTCSSFHFFPVNLSGSPFRVSDASCSRLSLLRSCSPSSLPNCTQCAWECGFTKNPVKLLHGCGSIRPLPEQGCQADVLGYLEHFFFEMGFQIEWDEAQDSYFSSCKDCRSKNGVCGFNSSDPNKEFICFQAKTTISPIWNHVDHPHQIAILSSVFALICIFLVFSVTFAVLRSKKLRSQSIEEDPTSLFLRRHRSASLLPPVFTYEELESSTNKFDPNRKIGDGGFGSVYLGQLRDNRIVAVKYLHKSNPLGNALSTKFFCNEILILSSINHPNLVKLHGYCSDPRGLLLVYDYVPNGTLADHLHGRPKTSLTWPVRLEIALQTALAIEYLHFSVLPPIVHRDITTSNIFVERDMRIKVGDFGLSRLLVFPENSSSKSEFVCTGPQGTPGYLDPDYHRSFRLTEKSDVYSFGVVLLELISGLKAVDQRREKREMALADLVVSKIQMGLLHQVVDHALSLDGKPADGVDAVAELAFRCVATDKDDRPDAREIVGELKRIKSRTRVLRVSYSNGSNADVGKG